MLNTHQVISRIVSWSSDCVVRGVSWLVEVGRYGWCSRPRFKPFRTHTFNARCSVRNYNTAGDCTISNIVIWHIVYMWIACLCFWTVCGIIILIRA